MLHQESTTSRSRRPEAGMNECKFAMLGTTWHKREMQCKCNCASKTEGREPFTFTVFTRPGQASQNRTRTPYVHAAQCRSNRYAEQSPSHGRGRWSRQSIMWCVCHQPCGGDRHRVSDRRNRTSCQSHSRSVPTHLSFHLLVLPSLLHLSIRIALPASSASTIFLQKQKGRSHRSISSPSPNAIAKL